MRILYVALKYDYGKAEQGYGFEHYNFYHSLLHMGNDILYFDFMSLLNEKGKFWMNRRLAQVVQSEKPDLMFTVLFTDQLDEETIKRVSVGNDVMTLNWFCDDHWRFEGYSQHWAPCFNWVVTTARSAIPKYTAIGYRNVIKSQWGCNHWLYRKMDLPIKYDVSFVGQPHGNRRQLIQQLRDAGIKVHVWGSGWESGRLTQEEMIAVFNQSRINLNLSNASMPIVPHRFTGFGKRMLDVLPFHVKKIIKSRLGRQGKIGESMYREQIKGRNFEVPGAGGFLLSGGAENLDEYYRIGEEVICFKDVSDLIEKIRYYLAHEDERRSVANAGYQRTLSEHTYAHRFNEIFSRCGLPCHPLEDVLQGKVTCGQTIEIH